MSKRDFGVVLVFLVGCAVGGGASQIMVPPATAQHGAARPRWEYASSISDSESDLRGHANRLGGDGWELVNAAIGPSSGMLWFKRPKL